MTVFAFQVKNPSEHVRFLKKLDKRIGIQETIQYTYTINSVMSHSIFLVLDLTLSWIALKLSR